MERKLLVTQQWFPRWKSVSLSIWRRLCCRLKELFSVDDFLCLQRMLGGNGEQSGWTDRRTQKKLIESCDLLYTQRNGYRQFAPKHRLRPLIIFWHFSFQPKTKSAISITSCHDWIRKGKRAIGSLKKLFATGNWSYLKCCDITCDRRI